MKHIITLSLFILVCSFARADKYEYLVFTTTSGDMSMICDGVVITFSENELLAVNSEETLSIPLSTLSKFAFSYDTTGLESIFSDLGTGPVDIYNAAGIYMGRMSYTTGETLSLPKGIYILKGDSGSKKLIVR